MTPPARWFGLHPGEGARAGWMVLYLLAAVGGVIITGSLVSRALFLSALPAEDIPYKYLLPPLALILVSAAYARLSSRWSRPQLIYLVCTLSAIGIFGVRWLLGIQTHSFWLLCGLYIFIDVVSALVILQFWTFAGDLFTAREARRVFPLITAGSTLSNLLFGLGLSAAATRVDPGELLLIMVASLASIVVVTSRLAPSTLTPTGGGAQKPATTPTRADLHSHPLLPAVAGLILLVTVVSNIADYQLDLALQRHFVGDGRGMLSFLGGFRFWSGLGACVLQFFFARRLLERFGVGAALLLLPVAIAGGSLAILLTGGALWAVSVPRGSDVVLKYTIHDASLNLLFLPIPDTLRAAAKTWIEGVLKPPVATALALLFLWAGPDTTPQAWAAPVLILVIIWLWLGRRAARLYVEGLAQSLQMRRLDLTQVPLRLTDESTIGVIRRALDADDALKTTQAIGWIEQMGASQWRDELVALARHSDAAVRTAALGALAEAELSDEEATKTLRLALTDDNATVRRAAVDGLGTLTDTLITDLQRASDDPAAQVRYSALRVLARHGDTQALQQLEQQLRDPGPERPMALAALAEGGHLSGAQLQTWLGADDADTLRAALDALPTKEPTPWRRLAQLLLSPAVRGNARDALRRCARQDPEGMLALCRDETLPPRHRAHLVRLLAGVDHGQVHAALVDLSLARDERLRGAAVAALLSRRRHVSTPMANQTIDAGLTTELSAAETRQQQIRALGDGDDGLLGEALQQRQSQSLDRALMWCDLGHGNLAHRWLTDSLQGDDPRRRGAALELLDEVLDHEHARRLLALLETGGNDTRHDPIPVLRSLVADEDAWLRAGAVRAIGQRHVSILASSVGTALRDDDSRVREAALEAVVDLSGVTTIPAVDDVLQDADYVRDNPLCPRITNPPPPGTRAMPLSTFEKVFFLRSVPLFSPLTGEEISALAQIVEEQDLTAGDQFITRGEEGDCLYVVVEGQARIDLITTQRHLGPREVIGELAILAHRPRSADCFADTDMLLLRIARDPFWELLETRPEITMQIMKVLVERYVPEDA
ncbi:MAG: cyclic nucleotide-binding domain-containing protein [Gemmatimonadetes bacterium]|nr:cyclic nucleotide-binding domain-containing protein [Gemmatimonadota bacterium]